ncbi:amidase [Mucilaginibacter ginkgonis]|uniref:Amidase n=1 Tax=Mucilaginibacter ginkgonis TaxID=2682091 RepID=A0A6I4I1Z8_9SPHI|nr:amidase [Mucilaginibacter ginkgonis]QQL50648.1 amidase [Mucilaginibacter ginkgonis]
MQRRNFLKTGSIASLSLGTLLSATDARAGSVMAEEPVLKDNFELNEVTIPQLQQMMQSGKYTSKKICEMYLKRIDAMDKKGPVINAVIELNKKALTIAAERDKERAAGKLRGPMHGIPVLIKDNITTGDGMVTSAGALALGDNYASYDAHIVKLLREAGAVILGKTNLSEWANFRSDHSTSGWSSRGGQTKNPNVLDRQPSGSSSGSGAAASANFCAIAIGTETNGSIVSPASNNGLVGIKPTVGLWSRTGIIPISKTQDTAGPMARNVTDAAILLGALTGEDAADEATLKVKGKALKDYTKFLNADALQGKRLGVEKAALQGNAAMVAFLNEALDLLKSKGAAIVEVELVKQIRQIGNAETTVLQYEFKEGVNRYLATANSKMKTLADVIAFNKANAAATMPYFKQETLEASEARGGLDSKEYLEALAKVTTMVQGFIDTMLKENKLDAIIGPTSGFAGCIDLVNNDYGTGFSFSGPAAMAGYPHITVPMGYRLGLPMGLSFFGTAYSEPSLIGLAYAYEQASKKRQSPEFKSVVG